MTDTYLERARRLADATSSRLSDEQRAQAITAALPGSRVLLDVCKDVEGACVVAISIARLLATVQMLHIAEVSEFVESSTDAYGMMAGILCGSVTVEGAEAAEAITRLTEGWDDEAQAERDRTFL